MIYFSTTTLSTVGFGDFHPTNDAERIFITIGLLLGVSFFSYLLGEFIQTVRLVMMPESDRDEENLSRFFGLRKGFNGREDIKPELKT